MQSSNWYYSAKKKKSNGWIFTGLFLPEFSHSCACHMLCDTSDLCWLTNGKTLSLHFNAFFPFFGKKSVTVKPILFKKINHLSVPENVDVIAIWIVVRGSVFCFFLEVFISFIKSWFVLLPSSFSFDSHNVGSHYNPYTKFSRVDQKRPNKTGYQAKNHTHKKYEWVWKYRQTGN